VRTLEAFRQRHTIPEDLPPISTDEELVAWGQQLVGKPAEAGPRREPLRAQRVVRATRAKTVEDAPLAAEPRRRQPLRATAQPQQRQQQEPSRRPRRPSAETMTLDELFDEIAARATGAHRGARLRAIR
jgi:hypothetical protein